MHAALRLAVIATVGAWAWVATATQAAQSPSWIDPAEQARLVESVRQGLPAGWVVARGPLGHTPDDWNTLDNRTFEIQGINGQEHFRVWFVPIDWIGIRRPDPRRTYFTYWEGVLSDARYKAISPGVQFPPYEQLPKVPVYQALKAMKMQITSLVNNHHDLGFRTFGDRLDDVDERTQRLVRQFCGSDRACEDEAAYSLIVLGVPARALTLQCVDRAEKDAAQQYCADLLGIWDLPGRVPLLHSLVSRDGVSGDARRLAAVALNRIGDASSGPSLAKALDLTPLHDHNTAEAIAKAIARVHYRPAGDAILERLGAATDGWITRRYAESLGKLRHTPAVPAIQALCEVPAVSPARLAARHNDFRERGPLPELSLLRITGSWGAPVNGLRLSILAPDSRSQDGRFVFAKVMENVGDRDLDVRMTQGTWVINGREMAGLDDFIADGNPFLSIGDIHTRAVDLGRAVSTPGSYRVEYRLKGAASNSVTLDVR